MVVDPVALAGGQPVEVELADRDDGVAQLAVDLVAVDVERVGELVVGLDRLQLLERRRDHRGVDQPDAGDRVGVVAQLAGLAVVLALYWVVSALARPYAARVASMLRSMYGASSDFSDGLTWNFWTTAG